MLEDGNIDVSILDDVVTCVRRSALRHALLLVLEEGNIDVSINESESEEGRIHVKNLILCVRGGQY